MSHDSRWIPHYYNMSANINHPDSHNFARTSAAAVASHSAAAVSYFFKQEQEYRAFQTTFHNFPFEGYTPSTSPRCPPFPTPYPSYVPSAEYPTGSMGFHQAASVLSMQPWTRKLEKRSGQSPGEFLNSPGG